FGAGEDAGGDAWAAVVGVDGDGVDVADPVDEGAPYAGGDLRVEHPLGRADVDGADGGAVGGFGEQEVVQAVGERSALGAQGLRDGVLEGGEFVGGQVEVDEQGEVEVRVEFVGLYGAEGDAGGRGAGHGRGAFRSGRVGSGLASCGSGGAAVWGPWRGGGI